MAGSNLLTSSTALRIGGLSCALAPSKTIEQSCGAKADGTTH